MYVRFKSEPFKYIPKEYLIYIKENAELVEQEVIETETWGPLNGYQALLEGLFEVRRDYQYPIATVVLSQMFLACTSDEAAEKLQVTPHLYEDEAAADLLAYLADKNNLDIFVRHDKPFIRSKDEALSHSVLDEYVNFHCEESYMEGVALEIVFDDTEE